MASLFSIPVMVGRPSNRLAQGSQKEDLSTDWATLRLPNCSNAHAELRKPGVTICALARQFLVRT
jgi:hypothetical protein